MCRSIANGGRRCPCTTDPVKRAAYNARRRELRQAQKLGLPIPPVSKTAGNVHGANSLTAHTSTPEGTNTPIVPVAGGTYNNGAYNECVSRNKVLLDNTWDSDQKILDVTPHMAEAGFFKTNNIVVSPLNETGYGIYDNYTLHGVINASKLGAGSAREFGFIHDAKDWANRPNGESNIPGVYSLDMSRNSQMILENIHKNYDDSEEYDKHIQSVRTYTRQDDYRKMNSSLYNKRSVSEFANRYNQSPEYALEAVKKYENDFKNMDTLISQAPQVQKTVFRATNSNSSMFAKYDGNISKWRLMEGIRVGSTLSFDGYLSTTTNPDALDYFGKPDDDEADTVIYEIKTPQGLSIEHVTTQYGECEVILPRKTRFKIVGYSKAPKEVSSTAHMHVFQLVAVNENDEILDGTNHTNPPRVWWDENGNYREGENEETTAFLDDFDQR